MVGNKIEAFRTMSAFFVHDLKNATSSLSLMLQNLPVDFLRPGLPRGCFARDRRDSGLYQPSH